MHLCRKVPWVMNPMLQNVLNVWLICYANPFGGKGERKGFSSLHPLLVDKTNFPEFAICEVNSNSKC
jgi:hypothetical protein